jgi:hypothetical protein
MNQGLLISSFSQGLLPNKDAHVILQKELVRSLLTDHVQQAESQLEQSVMFSPCSGPDIDVLERLECMDGALQQTDRTTNPLALLPTHTRLPLRFVYIPTAMYALRPDSNNTPGKQRQRARADGKARRNDIVALIRQLLPNVDIQAVTLDLDDGSIKHAEGSGTESDFPKTGKEAMQAWRPNLVYIQGGNTFWLYHCMEKGHWKNDLIKFCRGSGFFIGSSAGAIVAGACLETACWKGWDDPRVVPMMETYADWKNIKGLRMAGNYSFFPHMDNEWNELVKEKSTELPSDLICLRDEEACFVNGQSKSIQRLSIMIQENSETTALR